MVNATHIDCLSGKGQAKPPEIPDDVRRYCYYCYLATGSKRSLPDAFWRERRLITVHDIRYALCHVHADQLERERTLG